MGLPALSIQKMAKGFVVTRNKQEKRVSSGKYIDLANFTVEDVDIDDINRSLNMQRRFTGHYKDVPPLTVAQHTLLCTILSEMLFPGDEVIRKAVVLHDWEETFTGDIITPIKFLIGPEVLETVVKPVKKAIYQKFWPYLDIDPMSDAIHKAVKICDYLSLDIERRVMWKDQTGKDKWPQVDFKLSLLDKQALFNEVANAYVDLGLLLEGNAIKTGQNNSSNSDSGSLSLFVG